MEVKEQKISLLDGRATELLEISSKIVRVFISSTFSDMIWERNALMERVYPKLKDYCRDKYGLEFQAVDMRWGVVADAQNDHQASSLCLQEIYNCQKISAGPNCVVLIGQKYGSRPFPTYINQSEFELLRSVLERDDPGLKLLDTWFKLDNNAIPSEYILQPINSILLNYNDEDPDLQKADRQKWWQIFTQLQVTVRKAAELCHEQALLDTKARDQYFISVTENEIQHAVLQYQGDRKKKCLCFVRDIKDLSQHQNHEKAEKFLDMDFDPLRINEEAQNLLQVLRDEKLTSALPQENISPYEVSWSEKEGINPEDHANYLNQFCEDFYENMVNLVDLSMKDVKGLQQDQLLTEVVQHLEMKGTWSKIFHGREDVLVEIQNYILGSSNHPLVIHGASGSGKTAIIAKSASLSHSWLQPKSQPVLVVRFLGITPKSSNIRTVLETVCQQICTVYGRDPSTVPTDFAQLMPYFHLTLQVATQKRPLVIFLDSVDQLSPSNFAFKLNWLPKVLPAHVKLVLSTMPDMYDILDNLRTMLGKTSSFIELEALGDTLSQETLFDRLGSVSRTLSEQQKTVVLELFKKCSLPLFTKIMFEEIRTWKSYDELTVSQVASTIEGSIHKMLERLEIQHGRVLVSHTLAYLTASTSGLTMVELEDLLSLDDEVLNCVFVFWLPPIRRIPPSILTQIRLHLAGYVVEREADSVAVIYWYHRKFIEVARARYLSDKDFARKIHSNLADYFIGTWGGGTAKPFTYTPFLMCRLNLDTQNGIADRKVPLQPLRFTHTVVENVSYNLRKLRELPPQLVDSGRLEDLKSMVVYSYQWHLAKIKAFSLQDLLADLALAQEAMPSETSIRTLIDVLRLGASALNSNPDSLSLELSGRLLDFYEMDPNIRQLIQDCDRYGPEQCMLTVPFRCFAGPTNSLLFSLEGHNKSICDVAFLNRKELVSFGWDGMLCYWDLETGEMLKQLDASFVEPNIRAFLLVSRDQKYLVSLNKVESEFLGIYLAETGDLLHRYHHQHSQHLHKIVIGTKYLCVDFGILDLEKGTILHSLSKYDVKITEFVCIDLTHNDKFILIGSRAETSMYEIMTGQKLFSIPEEQIASFIKVIPDGTLALIGYALNCLIKVIDVVQKSPNCGTEIRTIDFPALYPELGISEDKKDLFVQEVSELNISDDGTLALALLKRFYIGVWNLSKPELKPTILQFPDTEKEEVRVHNYYYSVSFTPDNKHIIGYKLNGSLFIWSVKTGQFLTDIAAHNNEIMQMRIDSKTNMMATVAKGDLTIKIWDAKNLASTSRQKGTQFKEGYIRNVAIPKNHSSAISLHTIASYSRKVYQKIDFFGMELWDVLKGTKTSLLPYGQYGQVVHMDCSDNGEVILLMMGNLTKRKLRVLDLKNSKMVFTCTQPYCTKSKLSMDGRFLASVTEEEGSYLTILRACEGGITLELYLNCYDVVFLPNSTVAVMLSNLGGLLTHDLLDGNKAITNIGCKSGKLYSLSGNQSTDVLVTTSEKQKKGLSGKVICSKTLKTLGQLEGISEGGIVAVSPGGETCLDAELKVFNLEKKELLIHLQPGTTVSKDKVRLLGGGNYVVWIDGNVSDLLKVCRIADNTIVASCNLHSTPVSMEVSVTGGSIIVGTNIGQILVFTLTQFSDSYLDMTKCITKEDRQNQLLSACAGGIPSSTTLAFSEISIDLQAELTDLAKQARIFTFSSSTLETKTSTLNEGNRRGSSTCILL